jgi:maltose alpha-D-glucosyltransferase/alpha-amylase
VHARRRTRQRKKPADPTWYKDAVIYELHVRSFQDSTDDGIGDFQGLTRRLGYLQDLGVTALWLLPFYPSPLRDDGYDISDYTGVHPDYGTIDDFRRFLDAAHRRGLKVITELVINHTSDQHPWFQRARTAPPGSRERDFYVWSQSAEGFAGARIIFEDFERSNWSWDPVAKAYYWHRFFSHQPDLNYQSRDVFDAMVGVLDFWFRMGVDGMRLDAVPYLAEQAGTDSENLRATHEIIKRLRRYVDARFPDRMFIAEANQWPEDAAAYFGDGDESHMVFHFPLMPRLFMAIRQQERLPIVDILTQTPIPPADCQWALFLRNHDELTLEMVTEEERLYMYDVYAADSQARINLGIRRRLAPLLGNDRRRIELMNVLLFSLPGTPVLYYGDEIGMGDNIYLGDRNGVRTPMQWSADRNAGFSRAHPQRLCLPLIIDAQHHYQTVHVEQQVKNPESLLWWMRRLIAARKRHRAFGRGDLEFLHPGNPHVLAFLRRWGDEQLLIVANLSGFVQYAELDLSTVKGCVPRELFSRSAFSPIAGDPYPVTLGPHDWLWLALEREAACPPAPRRLPRVHVDARWDELLEHPSKPALEAVVSAYLERCSGWMGPQAILSVELEDLLTVRAGRRVFGLGFFLVAFNTLEPQRYLVPIGCRPYRRGAAADADAIAEVRSGRGGRTRRGVLYDAATDGSLGTALLAVLSSDDVLHGAAGRLQRLDVRGAVGGRRQRAPETPWDGVSSRANPVLRVRDSVLKLFRRLEPGPHPEVEVGERLGRSGFRRAPALIASLRYVDDSRDPHAQPVVVGVLHRYVPHEGTAWTLTLDALSAFLRRAAAEDEPCPATDCLVPDFARGRGIVSRHDDLVGRSYLARVAELGALAADLHRHLASTRSESSFAPERFSALSRRSMYQRMRTLAVASLEHLAARAPELDEELQAAASALIGRREDVLSGLGMLLRRRIAAPRMRCHGDFHLGQVLDTGGDFTVLDFEGEAARPLYERRLRHSPLLDVATMVRSFHRAMHTGLQGVSARSHRSSGNGLGQWARFWQQRVCAVFVNAYWEAMRESALLPEDPEDVRLLFWSYLVERTFYELNLGLAQRSPELRHCLSDLPDLLTEA